VTDSPDFPDGIDEPAGAALARWRRRRRLSGQALGERVGMSQATISRLESGTTNPDPRVVRRVAEALELPAEEVERLVGLVERPSERMIDWQASRPGLADQQDFVRRLENSARDTRVFQSAVVHLYGFRCRIIGSVHLTIGIGRHLDLVVRRRRALEGDLAAHCSCGFRHVEAATGGAGRRTVWSRRKVRLIAPATASGSQRGDEERRAKEKSSFLHFRISKLKVGKTSNKSNPKI